MHTTIGTYGEGGRWVAVTLVRIGEETLVVDERMRRPDDPEAEGAVVGRFGGEEQARREGEARVLRLGGLLGEEPETTAGSPVRGQAAAELCPGAYEFPAYQEPAHPDGGPAAPEVVEELLGQGGERFVHVRAPVALGR